MLSPGGAFPTEHNGEQRVAHLKTGDYAGEWPNGYHVMLDSDELVTVLWEQVEEVGSPLPDQKYKSPR